VSDEDDEPREPGDAGESAEPAENAVRPGGLRLAVSLLTVLPVRFAMPDRAQARRAMLWAPFVGMGLGGVTALLVALGVFVGLPTLVIGLGAVGALALLTRGMHLDGLADTVDGLGSYAGRERALAIMKAPDVGAFGVVALILVALTQAASVAAVVAICDFSSSAGYGAVDGLFYGEPDVATSVQVVAEVPSASAFRSSPGGYLDDGLGWLSVIFIALVLATMLAAAVATGRLAITWACRDGVPAARPDGLGALVAGSVTRGAALAVTVPVLLLAALASVLAGHGPLQGPLAVLLGLIAAALLVRHCVRRFGGITGDVLGAASEVATTVTLLVLIAGR
jgi:adenosylcobinamide-GDP ribazoletransferase